MPTPRVSPQHAPGLLDPLLTMLTSNASSKGTSILKTLLRANASRVMAEEHRDPAVFVDAFDNSSGAFRNSSVLGVWEEEAAAADGSPGRRKLNLTLLQLDLSPVYPSLEAVSGDVQIFLIFVYSLAAVLSLVGNVTVILVLAFGRRSSVRCYLINLAVSDITMATFCIPFSYTSFMFHRWVFAPEFCRIVAFMQHVSVTCSVYTLVAIGVDRYKALIHPLNARWTKSRARLVIGGIWVFSVVISIVPLVVSDSERYDWDGEWYYECKENWPTTQNELYEKTYTVVLFVLTFALPVLGLGYTYLTIVGMMCSYRIPGNAEPSRDQQHFHAKVKVINMMVAVMACFVLSWFPLQVLQFLIYFAPEVMDCRGHQCFTYYMSFFTCHWIAMANSFMNPFIYCFMSNNFREDLLQFVRKCGRKRLQRQRSVLWSRSDPGSSFRSILYITPRTSVQSSSKTSFRAKSERQREGETLEMKSLRDRQSPLRTSRENSPALLSPHSPLRPGCAASGSRKAKLGVGTHCLQEVPQTVYLSPHIRLQHPSNHHVYNNNQPSRFISRRYKTRSKPAGCEGSSTTRQEERRVRHTGQGDVPGCDSTVVNDGSSNKERKNIDNVNWARSNEREACQVGERRSNGYATEGYVDEVCDAGGYRGVGGGQTLHTSCPNTMKNGVYECIDLEAMKRPPPLRQWRRSAGGGAGAQTQGGCGEEE